MSTLTTQWRLLETMRRCKGLLEKAVQPFCARHSLTPIQLRILAALHFEGEQTVSSLAKSTCMAGANNSAQCKRLEAMGLVIRKRDPQDERQVRVSLSKQGEALMQEFRQSMEGSAQASLQRFTPEDIEIITAGMNRFLSRMEEKKETPYE